ncbi:hypothetical protein [Bradyrhizobium guangxiense]|nr:hypothetical protein [Bradyrhizobium guangxiense]
MGKVNPEIYRSNAQSNADWMKALSTRLKGFALFFAPLSSAAAFAITPP